VTFSSFSTLTFFFPDCTHETETNKTTKRIKTSSCPHFCFYQQTAGFRASLIFKQKRQEKYTTYSKAIREAGRQGLGQATRLPQNKTSTKKT
jgi:hypothetical protein